LPHVMEWVRLEGVVLIPNLQIVTIPPPKEASKAKPD
jgi:hypothetical protein